MDLLTLLSLFQTLALCQASRNGSTSGWQNDSLPQQKQDLHINQTTLYSPWLSGECSGTLGAYHGERQLVVALPLASRETAAEQICLDLGCGGMINVSEGAVPRGSSLLTNCTYSEDGLRNCTLETAWGNGPGTTEIICEHQLVRLAGGEDRCTGRVELRSAGQWGTVCDDGWDMQAGHVVCAQLGCGYALNVTGQDGLFKPGSGPIHLDDVNCTGTERSLWNCLASHHSQDCGHKEDAGVVCSEMRAVRLTGGLDRCSGRVEIHRNGSWGTVCDNSWAKQEAGMVCSMLGCGPPEQFTAFDHHLPHSNDTHWYFFCKRQHTNLWQCREIINHHFLCKDSKAAMLICNGSLGLIPDATPATIFTPLSWSTGPTSTPEPGGLFLALSPPLWGCLALSLVLMLVLLVNLVLCCWCRWKYTFAVQQGIVKPQAHANAQPNEYRGTLDVLRIASDPSEYDAPPVCMTVLHQSSVDSSLEPDYEYQDPSGRAALSTFQNQHDITAEESYPQAVDQNVTPSEDSFDSSSTSSGECYVNTDNTSCPLLVDTVPEQSAVSQNGYSGLALKGESSLHSEGHYGSTPSGSDYDDIANYWH
ncbi:T-cell differentiation antigen CD6-like isoform X2 [Paramormyrops kingsleyae]|uniref:T-cell differentiation antigen CD6-like n=1 Tax=Paramormyrops kingsleyae TaxID=1676925 RepID=A0A3B3RNH1_9TELE|nr:T-cell differentiation antigen CD6-like isoform X2 [Paramormyrops kingsleyae]